MVGNPIVSNKSVVVETSAKLKDADAVKDALRDGYSLIKGSAEQLAELDRQELVGVRENRFGFEALCRREIARRHPGLASERPDIEQIMLFFTRRPSA